MISQESEKVFLESEKGTTRCIFDCIMYHDRHCTMHVMAEDNDCTPRSTSYRLSGRRSTGITARELHSRCSVAES